MYLSSFRLGNHPEYLVSLAEPGRRAAVIANAMDDEPDEMREAGVRRELDALSELGIEAAELDLRMYFGQPERLARDLRTYGLVWARGGNVFMLRYSLAASGGDDILRRLLDEDALVYGGYSAGPCLLGPTLRGFEIADDPTAVESTYARPPVWDGLQILDYVIVPHVDSPDHPETERCGAIANRYRAEGIPHRTLRDGQAIVVDGSAVSVQ
jgi:dipeptidase E